MSESEGVAGTTPTATLEEQALPPLPDNPLITIKPSGFWVSLDLRTLWEYRELLYFLVWRDVKVRYKQTTLGVAWAIIQPLFMTLIFTIVFGQLARISSGSLPYPLFAYSGLVLWTFFANAVSNGSNSLIVDSDLVTKVYFPRIIVPAAAVGAALVDFAIASVVLVGLMTYYSVGVSWSLLMLPVFVTLTALLAQGLGAWLSALNVKYRDLRYALPFLIQLSLFTSPVIYPSTLLPERLQWVYALNPLAGIIEGFRASLFGLPLNWLTLSISTAVTLVLLIWSTYAFRRLEKSIADII